MRTSTIGTTGFVGYTAPVPSRVQQNARALQSGESVRPKESRQLGRLDSLTAKVRAGEYHPDSQDLAEEIVSESEMDLHLARSRS